VLIITAIKPIYAALSQQNRNSGGFGIRLQFCPPATGPDPTAAPRHGIRLGLQVGKAVLPVTKGQRVAVRIFGRIHGQALGIGLFDKQIGY